MKTLITAIVVATVSPTLLAATSESQTLRARVEQQVNRLNINADENSKVLAEEIHNKYGFKVQCDRGFAGVFDALSETNCHLGLQSLDQALAQVNPDIDRELLDQVTIELADVGDWQGATFTEKEIKVPYNAHPVRIQEFVNQQVNVLFNTSLEELEKSNARLEKGIKASLNYKVIPSPTLQAAEYNEGLKKLKLAAQKTFAGSKPSSAEYEKLGFDTVVIGRTYIPMRETDGELRVQIDYKEKPGKIFLQLIQQVHPVQSKWREAIAVVAPAHYSWSEVQDFRQARAEVNETSKWLVENYPTRKVECILEDSAKNSVDMKECRDGITHFRATLEKYGTPPNEVAAQKVVIGDSVMRNNFYIKDQDALLVSHDASMSEMYNSLSANKRVRTPR